MTDDKVAGLIRVHVARYPEIELIDVYKLLHQAIFGPGRTIPNQKVAQELLQRECETLKPVATAPILESVHPEGAIVRLHLRPYLAANGHIGKLVDAFVKSAKAVDGDPATMVQWWAIFEGMIKADEAYAARFDIRTLTLVGRTRSAEHWPASHHSPRFDRTYQPVYRVLTRALAESLLQGQKIAFQPV